MNMPHLNHHASHPQRQSPENDHQDVQAFAEQMIRDNPVVGTQIVTRAPEEPFRLSFLDATCLIVNRTIGTGIFTAPAVVMRAVKSPGLAIVLWLCGCLYGIAGSHVFLEYGLNVPRFIIDGVEQSVPRSGGELHYLQYIFPWPRYRENTVIFMGVLFGISFICVGNMASNCIDCALRILEAANPDMEVESFSQGAIYGIAISIATMTCFIHAISRRGGILLSNAFAFVKVGFLVFIIVTCWVVAGGWSGINGLPKGTYVKEEKTSTATDPNGATAAFLAVIFAFYGFDQSSYVLGEIKHPRKTLKRSMWWGMGIISVLYVAVNICFMIVVPSDVQIQGDVAQAFFDRAFSSNISARRTTSSLLAISSFGNIVVWTYTAARMKQEIAKQCFIPFSLFFGNNMDVSIGRFLLWLENKFGVRFRFINPANHQEKTPVGALILHLVACLILMMATYGMKPRNAYTLLSGLFSYIVAVWFGSFLAVGILILHFRGTPPTPTVKTGKHARNPPQESVTKTWNQMIEGSVNPKLGVFFACIYLIGSLFPVIMSWVPPSSRRSEFGDETLDWYMVPVVSWTVLAFSGVWFLGFVAIASYRSGVGNKTFVYDCQPEFEWVSQSPKRRGDREDSFGGDSGDLRRRGGFIMTHETITKAWAANETSELLNRPGGTHHNPHLSSVDEDSSQHQQRVSGSHFVQSNFANTDFAGVEMGNIGAINQHRGQR